MTEFTTNIVDINLLIVFSSFGWIIQIKMRKEIFIPMLLPKDNIIRDYIDWSLTKRELAIIGRIIRETLYAQEPFLDIVFLPERRLAAGSATVLIIEGKECPLNILYTGNFN